MKVWKLFSLLLLLAPLSAMAQVGVYGEFSSSHINARMEPQIYGVTFGAYYDKHVFSKMPFLSLGPDFRLTMQSGSSKNVGLGGPPAQSILFASAGPRFAFKVPVARLHPYVEGLAGAGNSQIGEVYNDSYSRFHPGVFAHSGDKNGGASFTAQALGGLDFAIKPRVDWRVVEFGYTQIFSTGTTRSFGVDTLSTGIVVRIPSH
ncbi:MAG TPA: hypothetical protein VFN53_06615 [Acidobacteriaceae bacterium]|nr:hypothetical protein [Acidobacteriaceae bacterium]